jgi:Na+/H+-dicarboxylate symporter
MRLKLHHQILIAMVVGAAIGLPLNILAGAGRIPESWPRMVAVYGKGVGDVFLRLLSMIVAPLILTSLVTGVTGTGNLKGLGRMGGRTLAYYISTSMIAIITGMLVFNVIQPGKNSDLAQLEEGAEVLKMDITSEDQSLGRTMWNQVFNLIPSNPFASLADPANRSILGVIFFAIVFGISITVVGGETGKLLTSVFAGGFEVMMRLTMFIIKFAPVGVFGFMLYASAGKGLVVFKALGWYALTVAVGLSIHAFLTLPLLLRLLGGRSPREYFKSMSPALLTAFSTASSNGTLPLTLTCVEERAGISNRISSFVLPLGATINMDGTALYEAVAVLFIAQVSGNDLSLAQQVVVAITALLASIGAAGIPHAGTVMMVVVLSAVGLPIEYVGLILAVDRVLDMYRTSINVWSDSTACAVVARFEPEEAGEPPRIKAESQSEAAVRAPANEDAGARKGVDGSGQLRG